MTPLQNDTVVSLSILVALALWGWLGWYLDALWLAVLGPITGFPVGVLVVWLLSSNRDRT